MSKKFLYRRRGWTCQPFWPSTVGVWCLASSGPSWDRVEMGVTAAPEHANVAAGARVGALLVALFWATVFFGIIDLSVVPDNDVGFYEHYLLATGWGLLFTFLIPLPLLSWAVRPQGWNGPQVAAIAAAVFLAGLVGLAPGQVVVTALVAGSAAFPHMWKPRPGWSLHRALARPAYWPLDALVAVGVAAALTYGWDMLDAARGGASDDNTLGLMHLPMQAAFGLATAASAVVAVLALANGVAGWWFAFLPAALSAAWFGVVARAYPDHLGSIGEVGGTLTIGWGAGLLMAALGTGTDPAFT